MLVSPVSIASMTSCLVTLWEVTERAVSQTGHDVGVVIRLAC